MAKPKAKSEGELVKLAQSGDRDAFDTLVRQCAEKIYNLCLRLTGSPEDAEDLSQDAFVNAFRGISKFKEESSFSSWMYRITVNLWKNRVKYEKRRFFLRHFSLSKPIESEEGEITRELPNGSNPESELEKTFEKSTMQKIMNELDEKSRMIIVLRDVEGRSYEEISAITGYMLGTVKSRLARARELLKERYLKYHKDDKK